MSMGFSRQEYWSRLPFPTPAGLPHPGIELTSPIFSGEFLTTSATWEALSILLVAIFLLYPHTEEGRESMEKESRLWCLFIQGH